MHADEITMVDLAEIVPYVVLVVAIIEVEVLTQHESAFEDTGHGEGDEEPEKNEHDVVDGEGGDDSADDLDGDGGEHGGTTTESV